MHRRLEGEISPLNATAIRGPNGFWNEHVLPITEWGDPARRVVLPSTLVTSLTLSVAPVLRWDAAKYRDVIAKHQRDRHVIANLTEHLRALPYHGEETDEHAGNQRILFQDETGRWYAVSIGPLGDSDNMITIIGSNRAAFRANRLRGLINVIEHET